MLRLEQDDKEEKVTLNNHVLQQCYADKNAWTHIKTLKESEEAEGRAWPQHYEIKIQL